MAQEGNKNLLNQSSLNETLISSQILKGASYKEQLTINDSMKSALKFLKSNSTVTIDTPFQGTSLQVTPDEKKIVFTSRSITNQGARLAVANIITEEVSVDQKISDNSIWTCALSRDSAFVFTGGIDGVVDKYRLSDLFKLETFAGHSGDINKILISSGDQWMYTAGDDGTVRVWTLRDSLPKSKVLIESRKEIYALDLSSDDRIIVAGGNGREIYVFILGDSFEDPGNLVKTINVNDAIWSLKISPQVNFFCAGFECGEASIFTFNDYTKLEGFKMKKRISDLGISSDENIVIAASRCERVGLFYRNKSTLLEYSGHNDWVKRAQFIQDCSKIVSLGDDQKIKIWNLLKPDTDENYFKEDNLVFKKIWISKEGNLEAVYAKMDKGSCEDKCQKREDGSKYKGPCLKHGETIYASWNNLGIKTEIMKVSDISGVFTEINADGSEILLAQKASNETVEEFKGEVEIANTYVWVVNAEQKAVVKRSLFGVNISSLGLSQTNKYFIIGELFRFHLIRYNDMTLIDSIYSVFEYILASIFDSDDSTLFIGSQYSIRKYEFYPDKKQKIKEIEKFDYQSNDSYSQEISFKLTEDSQYLFAVYSGHITLFHSETFTKLLQLTGDYKGVFFNLNHTIFLFGTEFLEILSGRSFQKISTIYKPFSINHVLLNSSKNKFYMVTPDGVIISENPLSASQLTLVGDTRDFQNFSTYIDRLLRKEIDDPYLDSLWLIEPLHINLLHIYAYLNKSGILEAGIIGNETTRIPVINSRSGFSALSVAIDKNFKESIDSIVKPIRRLAKEQSEDRVLKQMLFQVIEESIIDLVSISYFSLHKLLNDVVAVENGNHLSNFGPKAISLPLMVRSNFFFPEDKEFGFNATEEAEMDVAVVFKKSLMKFYLEIGSSKSLDFMKALADCENEEIYDTKIVQKILEYKWSKLRWFMYAQAFLYLVYLALLCLYTSYDPCRTSYFLVFPFAVSGALYVYELVFVFLGFCTYFSDFWNVVDTLRSFMVIIYCVLVWTGYFTISNHTNEKERYMLAVLLFISWMRGVTYFRINAETRYLIKLLFRVLGDIIPFLIILFYSILAFNLIFRAFDSDPKSDDFNYVTKSYIIILGQWSNPSSPDFYSVIILLATMLNPIISLNLLIAILTNTFTEVQDREIVADSQELAEMIVEIETLIFCTRKNNRKSFIHLMEKDSTETDQAGDLNKFVLSIKSKINYLRFQLGSHDRNSVKLVSAISGETRNVKEAFENFKWRNG